jgi:hypothetical protein
MAQKVSKFFSPGGTRGRDQQVAAMQARETRYDNAVSATVAALRGEYDAEGERIAKLAAELGLERFSDPLQEIDARLARAIEVARVRIEILTLERALYGVHTPGQGMTAPLSDQKKKDFAARLALLKSKLGEPAGEPAPRPAGALPEQIERALAVADAQPAPKKVTPEKLRAQVVEDIDELEAGRRELGELIEENRKEASYQANLKAKAAHDELLVELYRTAQKFAAVAAQEQSFRMVFPSLNLTARSDLLPMPGHLMQILLLLGSDADWNSTLSEYRRWLDSRGLLK